MPQITTCLTALPVVKAIPVSLIEARDFLKILQAKCWYADDNLEGLPKDAWMSSGTSRRFTIVSFRPECASESWMVVTEGSTENAPELLRMHQ